MEVAAAEVPVSRAPARQPYDMSKFDVMEFDPLINKFINEKLYGYQSSDVCMDREDIVQECRMLLLRVPKDFDPTRGMKVESYIYMLLDSRLGNLRNKVARKNEAGTQSFTDLNGWAITGGQSNVSETSASPYHNMQEIVDGACGVENSLIQMIDIENVRSRLKGFKKVLYDEYYLNSLTLQEIHKKYPDVKYHKIRRDLESLEGIHNTLCLSK